MMQFLNHKSSSLIMGAIAILLLVLLAASLDSLEFRKGEPFSYVEVVEESEGPPGVPDMGWLYIIVIGIYVLIMFLTLFYAPKDKRRKIILALLAFALVIFGIMWWMTLDRKSTEVSVPTPTGLHTAVPMDQVAIHEEEQGESVVYLQPKISPWISIGVTFGVLFVVAMMIWLLLGNRFKDNVRLEELAEIAEQTVSDLHAGKDYGDAVINCYANMMMVLNKKRGILRRGNLTPAEFIAVLERASLPSKSVRKLTALFEQVRYGGKRSSQMEVEAAVNCLNEIVGAIRDVQ